MIYLENEFLQEPAPLGQHEPKLENADPFGGSDTYENNNSDGTFKKFEIPSNP